MEKALTKVDYWPQMEEVRMAAKRIAKVSTHTPLMRSRTFSNSLQAEVLVKREDLQQVRSYKIRGAYNRISSLSEEELKRGVTCASAGNHAQGVAFACNQLQVQGTIYMPVTTPQQKVEQTKMFGGPQVQVILEGDSFDDSFKAAMNHCETHSSSFIHPFDDEKVIEGQATIGLELLEQAEGPIDYLFVPVGGGGLLAGLVSVFKDLSPQTKIIAVEPEGAASMSAALTKGEVVELTNIDCFVDGAAVKKVGSRNFSICKEHLDGVRSIPEGKICQTILDLYNKEAIVVEPAGALTLASLDYFAEEIKGKRVVCILSGGNNDITRTAEIKERALLFSGLKHYFVIRFPQRAGALKDFVANVLGPNDDITHFEYSKKHSRENGPAVVGIELQKAEDLAPLVHRMKAGNFFGHYLNESPDLFQFLI